LPASITRIWSARRIVERREKLVEAQKSQQSLGLGNLDLERFIGTQLTYEVHQRLFHPVHLATLQRRDPHRKGGDRVTIGLRLGIGQTGMAAGAPSVHQIIVETVPDCGYFAFVAGPSVSTLATFASSCPVMTRRIGG